MKLADLFIELSTKGIDAVKKDLDKLKAQANETKDAFEQFRTKIVMTYGDAANAVRGFYRAGFAGTQEANLFAVKMRFLSQQIASLFIPTMNMAMQVIDKVTNIFRGLSGSQQDNLRHWLLGTAAAVAAAVAAKGVIAAVHGAAAAFAVLNVAIRAAWSGGTMGLSNLIEPLIKVAAAIFGFAVGAGAFNNMLNPVIEKIQKIATLIMDKLEPVMDQIIAAGEQLMDALIPLFDELMESLKDTISLFTDLLMILVKLQVFQLSQLIPVMKVVAELLVLINKVSGFHLLAKVLNEITGALGLRGDIKKKTPGRHDVTPGQMGFEDVGAAFKRIQQTALTVSTIPEQHLDVSRKQLDEQKKTNAELQQLNIGLA